MSRAALLAAVTTSPDVVSTVLVLQPTTCRTGLPESRRVDQRRAHGGQRDQQEVQWRVQVGQIGHGHHLNGRAGRGASASLPTDLGRLLVDAAAALSRDRRLRPGTPAGDRVLPLLTAAATSSDDGEFLQ